MTSLCFINKSTIRCCFCSVTEACPILWPPRTAAPQAPLPPTVHWSLLKLMAIESVTLSNQLILCRPLLLLPSVFSSIRVFSNESALYIRWPKYLLSEPYIWMQIFLQFSLMPRKALLVTGSPGPLGVLFSISLQPFSDLNVMLLLFLKSKADAKANAELSSNVVKPPRFQPNLLVPLWPLRTHLILTCAPPPPLPHQLPPPSNCLISATLHISLCRP